MSTLTEYLVLAKKRLAVTCDRRNILKREYDPLFFNFEAACDDLYKLIRIVEIQREGLDFILHHDHRAGVVMVKAVLNKADEIAGEV